jgi:hypothetical protein
VFILFQYAPGNCRRQFVVDLLLVWHFSLFWGAQTAFSFAFAIAMTWSKFRQEVYQDHFDLLWLYHIYLMKAWFSWKYSMPMHCSGA